MPSLGIELSIIEEGKICEVYVLERVLLRNIIILIHSTGYIVKFFMTQNIIYHNGLQLVGGSDHKLPYL